MPLPPPTGPFPVGTITLRLQDPNRPAYLTSPVHGRKLFLKLWYPSERVPAGVPEMLWNQLRDGGGTPPVTRWLLRLIERGTASYPGAALANTAPVLCPIVYNHGLVSFASENTSMMQELASRGYIVIAIQHEDQWSEFQALKQREPLPQRQLARALSARIRRADASERARLASQLYAAAGSTHRIAVERARDTQFVLDQLPSLVAAIPGGDTRGADLSAVHLVGYSLGGAVATQVAGSGRRATCVVNIDGGLYGSSDASALRVPYLMMYSARNEAINDELLPKQATRIAAPGTHHLNYHDVAGLVPPLRWIRAVGPTDPIAALHWRNQTVAGFLRDSAAITVR